MANELKPCPFCGGNSISFRNTPDMDTEGKFHCVSCNECGAKSREKFAMDACPLFYEELRNQWNTRPAAPVGGLDNYEYGFPSMTKVERGGDWCTRSQAETLLAAAMKDRLPNGHTILEQADTLDGRVSQTVRIEATGEEYERIVHADEAYGEDE